MAEVAFFDAVFSQKIHKRFALCAVPNDGEVQETKYWFAAFFGEHKPARVIVPTRELHHGALVEIEAMAEKGE